jgi:putative SOS response-associated peptidase YedK
MCGRFSFVASKEKTQKQFGIKIQGVLQPNYNIAPSQTAYIIANNDPSKIQRFVWGLIPSTTVDGRGGSNLINARAEGISSKASFRMPIRRRRCLVLADSFYEWRHYGHQKMPYRILLNDNSIITMAAVWDEWVRPDNQIVQSFSIITTEANQDIAPLHDRMPVILQTAEARNLWLQSTTELNEVIALLQPLPAGSLRMYPISPLINQVGSNLPELHKQIEEPPTLF